MVTCVALTAHTVARNEKHYLCRSNLRQYLRAKKESLNFVVLVCGFARLASSQETANYPL